MKRNERILFADILRVVATLGVVIVHTTADMIHGFNTLDRSWWWIANVFDASVRWSVPVFIMLSGMLLLGHDDGLNPLEFLRKRLKRVVIPLISWSVIYVIWDYRTTLQAHEGLDWWELFKTGLAGPLKFHLWFVYVIIGLYFMTPILRVFIRNDHKENDQGEKKQGRDDPRKNDPKDLENVRYFLYLWILAASILPFINNMWEYKVGIDFRNITGYIGYFVLGFYLHRTRYDPNTRTFLYGMAITSLTISIIGTYYITRDEDGTFLPWFYTYMSPMTICMASAIFVHAKNIQWKTLLESTPWLKAHILMFSSVSYGIYLMHILVLEFLVSEYSPLEISATYHHPLLGIPLTVTIVVLVSYVFCALFGKLKPLRTLLL